MTIGQTAQGGLLALLRRLIVGWALAGGAVLLALALMTTWSAISAFLFNAPVSGDFELTELGVAIAAFAFLPYCQLTGANVSADIFTARAGPRTVALLGLLASLIALGFSAVLLWRMYFGLLDYQQYLETTAILQIPLWYAFVPALVSLALLALASILTLHEEARRLRRGR